MLGKYNKPDGRYAEFKSRRDKQLKVLKKQKLKEPKANVEIKLDENNLCKLWSYKYKKFIKYDITNKFTYI